MDCASWWFDHVGGIYVYVLATRASDSRTRAGELDKLMEGAQEWGSLLDVPEASDLMGRYVLEIKRLADSAFAHDQAEADSAVDALVANLERQTDLYQRRIPGFPSDEWKKLFGTHIASTGGYVLALSAGDMPDFKAKYGQVLTNRNHLARLWGRVSMMPRR